MKLGKLLAAALFATALLGGCGDAPPVEEEKMPVESTEQSTELVEIKNGVEMPGYYYENNLADDAADPYILYHDGMYYLYCTGGTKLYVRKTQYPNVWPREKSLVLNLGSFDWAKEKCWAPEVFEHGGKFYIVFSAMGHNGVHSIDIAVSDTPDGTFEPLLSKPLLAPGYSVIDANVFFDDDGRVYLYYSKDNSTNTINGKRTSQIYGVELAPDFSSTIGEPVLISTPEQEWELKSGSVIWNEAPSVFKENGVYYLLYSANYYAAKDYSVGYATSDTPLARFEKPKNSRILRGNGSTVTGPGHCSLLRSPDGSEIYMVYHVHTVPPDTKNGRSLALDRLVICADGTLAVDGPSETRRPLPSGANGYSHVALADITVTAVGEKAEIASFSAVENLFDGIAKTSIEGIYSMDEGGSVEVKLSSPTELTSIMLYAPTAEIYVPGTVDVEINGTYIIRGMKFSSRLGNPTTVTLSNLPKDTAVETIKVTAHLAEGSEYAALSEIVMITKRQK